LIRSNYGVCHARFYLLDKAGVLMDDGGEGRAASLPDSGDSHPGESNLIKLLARSYSVSPNLYSVADAVIERAADHPTQNERTAAIPVLAALLRKPGVVARLRRGGDPFGFDRKAAMLVMQMTVGPWHPRPSTADFVDAVIEEVRSALLRASGPIEGD
jgi:hypothetical protein